MGGYINYLYEIGYAMSDDAGLATTRSSDDKEGTLNTLDCLPLSRVEIG
jgi:hypothetical protein